MYRIFAYAPALSSDHRDGERNPLVFRPKLYSVADLDDGIDAFDMKVEGGGVKLYTLFTRS